MEMTMKNMAWLSDPDLKEKVLLKMKQHRVEDSIIQGEYQSYDPDLASKYRGCLLGCTLPMQVSSRRRAVDSRWHEGVRRLYGIPVKLAYTMEAIFESLPQEDCADFAVDSIQAIPVGADLTWVMKEWDKLYIEGPEWAIISQQAKDLLRLLRNAPIPEPAQ